ncbi:MAG: PE domain-containing protein [Pseudonocardia sp.]
MSGVSGLGQAAVDGARGRAGAAAAFDELGMQVTPENVLAVRAVLMEEATELRQLLRRELHGFRVEELGGDPVSKYAAAGFNELNERYLAQCTEYINTLERAGKHLEATARSYGIAESEIATSFKKGQTHPPEPVSAPPPGPPPGLFTQPPPGSVERPWAELTREPGR